MGMHATFLPRAGTGVEGLDFVLGGGFARNRLHLLEGNPGSGKTTIALQFLWRARRRRSGIYVSLAETEQELRDGARSHGWKLHDKSTIFELVSPESVLDPEQQQSLLYSSDLELGETTKRILEAIERLKPKRVVIDSLSEIRLLAQSSLRYRRQVLALKHYFAQHQSTVMMLDDLTTESSDRAVHCDRAQRDPSRPVGADLRRRAAAHARRQMPRPDRSAAATTISSSQRAASQVFPRLVAAEHRAEYSGELLESGSRARCAARRRRQAGSSTLVLGPAGTGKSLLILQYIAAAVERGERAALFVFDEELGLLFARAKALGSTSRRCATPAR